ncbi:hypothetical protein L2E82_38927 [Cichorium intybus]|uniref:Uncharacterized protein n=1 Tax=Cichorium intybus TaxID=13427 RepID=A0ACB9AH50_CICIN|nr:hypothetical protein L2E82_38927 [Cichorium intybus]
MNYLVLIFSILLEVYMIMDALYQVMGEYGYIIEHILMVEDIIHDPCIRRSMNEINAGGVGVAKQRQAITDGLRENILNFSHKVEGASTKEVMDLIMITQYFDTIKDLGNSSKNTTVFIPHGLGHVRDISDHIRNGLMEGKTGSVHDD